jgi:hypothetical protein
LSGATNEAGIMLLRGGDHRYTQLFVAQNRAAGIYVITIETIRRGIMVAAPRSSKPQQGLGLGKT